MKTLNGTDTSAEALRKMTKAKTKDQQIVFDELKKHGDKGLTSNELEKLVKNRRANSRVVELRNAGWIETTSEKRRNHGRRGPGTGGAAFVHIVPLAVRKSGLPISPKVKKTKLKQNVDIILVRGVEGRSVYINGYRVAGPKQGSGGEIIESWQANVRDVAKAIK